MGQHRSAGGQRRRRSSDLLRPHRAPASGHHGRPASGERTDRARRRRREGLQPLRPQFIAGQNPGPRYRGRDEPRDLGQDLAPLLREIGRAALECGTGAVVFVDEMQRLDAGSLAAIGAALLAVSRSGLPVAMVGAGQPDLRAGLVSTKPYADRLFDWAELGGLSEMAARHALTAPAAALGVAYEDAVVGRIVSETAGLPYLIQVYGSELWNYASSTPITRADFDAVQVLVRDALARGFFGAPLELGTSAERRYLSAMASLGQGPYAVGAVARAFGVEDQRRLSVHRDSLLHKGLIWSPRRGRGRLHGAVVRPVLNPGSTNNQGASRT